MFYVQNKQKERKVIKILLKILKIFPTFYSNENPQDRITKNVWKSIVFFASERLFRDGWNILYEMQDGLFILKHITSTWNTTPCHIIMTVRLG